MEQGLGSDSNAPPGSIDKSRVLDVKPIKTLVPVFPNQQGMSSISTPQPSPFLCVPPSGPFPSGVQPFYPFLAPNDPQHTTTQPGSQTPQQAPVPLNSFRTPTPQANGSSGRPRKVTRARRSDPVVIEDDVYSDSQNQSDQYTSGGFSVNDAEDASNSGKRRGRPKKRRTENGPEFDIDALVNNFLTMFKLKEFDDFRRSSGDKDTVRVVLLVYDLLRKKLTQLEEAKDLAPGTARRPDLKAANLLMTKGVRTNNTKRIGHLPGVDVGDIFFFRMELCVIGLHAPSMAGIDYMSVKVTVDEEPVALSIVSSGGYDDDGDDSDVLIYSGQGGVQRRDGQMFDQKLERGNLALEKSLHRANDVRVVRGIKDIAYTTGKIYVYDGLYKIQESWAEKNKSGCNVFKYKLVRVPGQPECFSLWKSIQQWKDGTATRPGVILPDLTSGSESLPVALVNDVDGEKGPAHFTYVSSLKYSRPFSTSKPSLGCHCLGGCQPGDANCMCLERNDGLVPYSPIGVLLSYKSPIYECGPTCACPPNCRNRISQAGVKVRLEVFKTKNRGWGLRSWDPIRAGGFICEYAGDIIEGFNVGDYTNENEDSYIFDATRDYEPLEPAHDPSASKKSPFPLIISAKNNGNVARFMNHGCSPNVFWQPVLRESNNEVCLHVAFFAARHVPPMQELTYDYGMVSGANGDKGKKKCLCGSVKCRGYFF
ncbi:histone-lysine n-methyltransferase h3 lysine-9 specific suvh1 [Phtheirospermum japonicum]|uniref:Histone-lysine n-methyltransferase h3 lysine-9 specific suvh1 n=1 Tax=Phtheirospermum japonicum TaxID=374723 RepID=A0A830B7W1_9LAMI|nr:histone-lysine n-methyltransferase h3 lysine-9 specific suvh1 [Phtheirospermum japonicum]